MHHWALDAAPMKITSPQSQLAADVEHVLDVAVERGIATRVECTRVGASVPATLRLERLEQRLPGVRGRHPRLDRRDAGEIAELDDPADGRVLGHDDPQRAPPISETLGEIEEQIDARAVKVVHPRKVNHHGVGVAIDSISDSAFELLRVRVVDLATQPQQMVSPQVGELDRWEVTSHYRPVGRFEVALDCAIPMLEPSSPVCPPALHVSHEHPLVLPPDAPAAVPPLSRETIQTCLSYVW